jgi:hypothetical protein
MRRRLSQPRYYSGLLLAGMCVLLASGYAHRKVRAHIDAGTSGLDENVTLSCFPKRMYGWDGNDLEISATTVSYMKKHFANDYVSRRYLNPDKGAWADVYVVYCTTRPASIIGHRPQVCYVNKGWIPDGLELTSFETHSGQTLPCLMHRFRRPAGSYAELVILNFYVVNGKVLTDEKQFSGLMGRRPNIGGKEAKYVARVQISSTYEHSVLEAARDMADALFEWLPDGQRIPLSVD